MKKTHGKFLSVLLILSMALALLPATALAADSGFTIENGVLTKYNGSGGDVVIPNGVTSIGDEAFGACTGLTSVTIPSGVTSIGWYAFSGCSSLTSVTIPSSVTSIEPGTFSGCTSLTSVTIPSSVTRIRDFVFSGCTGLTSVTIQEGVTSIEDSVFSGCTGLTSVTIPEGVTSIGMYAFEDCTGLTSVTIPGSVTDIGMLAFSGCSGLTSVTIFSGDTYIGELAFDGCTSLTSVEIPAGVTSIMGSIFADTPWLKNQGDFAVVNGILLVYQGNGDSVMIPGSVTSIGDYAFADCSGLTGVTIPSSVTSIGMYAFSGCSDLTSVTIPSSVTSIGMHAFSGCSVLTSVTIPSSVTSIGSGAFHGCSGLTSVTIPESVTSIEFSAFGECESLTDVYYGGGEEQWKAIKIKYGNDDLTKATIHYNSPMPEVPGPTEPETVGGFGDVKKGDYFADEVLWAVDKGITTGTGKTTFSPEKICTHGEIVTFLWRAAGKPQAAEKLMNGTEYYVDAVNWAYEQGMVDESFNRDAPCTRADTVKYLWQAAGKPEVSGNAGFTDVTAGADYAPAVAWAVEKKVTKGTSDSTFSPDMTCTRGQIVCFLYRVYY